MLLLVQVNDWQKDWVAFYAQQRIQPQMDMLAKGAGDRDALELWSALQVSAPLCPVLTMPCSPTRERWQARYSTEMWSDRRWGAGQSDGRRSPCLSHAWAMRSHTWKSVHPSHMQRLVR